MSIFTFLFLTTRRPPTSTLSLHDALPIYDQPGKPDMLRHKQKLRRDEQQEATGHCRTRSEERPRSEEHTSELQSPYDLVCRLLLEKKKNNTSSSPNKLTHTYRPHTCSHPL